MVPEKQRLLRCLESSQGAIPELCRCLQDNSEVGIRATISRLSALLQTLDPELWYHLNHKVKVCKRSQWCNSPRQVL